MPFPIRSPDVTSFPRLSSWYFRHSIGRDLHIGRLGAEREALSVSIVMIQLMPQITLCRFMGTKEQRMSKAQRVVSQSACKPWSNASMRKRIIIWYVKEMESEEPKNGQVGLSGFTTSVCKVNLQSKKLGELLYTQQSRKKFIEV